MKIIIVIALAAAFLSSCGHKSHHQSESKTACADCSKSEKSCTECSGKTAAAGCTDCSDKTKK